MSAADPAQAFGQQPPPSPIMAHPLLSASSPLTAPKLPNCKLPACTSCALAWLKKDQTNRSVQKCITEVSYKTRTTKKFPHGLQHRYIIRKGAKVAELQPPTPQSQWRQWPCRHGVHPGTEGTAFLGASCSHYPQVEAVRRHTNCFRKLKYICSYNLALISLFKSYRKLVGDFILYSFLVLRVF